MGFRGGEGRQLPLLVARLGVVVDGDLAAAVPGAVEPEAGQADQLAGGLLGARGGVVAAAAGGVRGVGFHADYAGGSVLGEGAGGGGGAGEERVGGVCGG